MANERIQQGNVCSEASKRHFVDRQMAQYEQGYRKLVVVGVYLALFGIITGIIGLIVGLVASYWWVIWFGITALVAGVLAVLGAMALSTRNMNHALAGMWTPIQHIEDGGAVQLKRLEDGNFVLLSVGVTHLNIYVTPKVGDLARTIQLASFGLNSAEVRLGMSRNERRPNDEQILDQIRELVGSPKSVEEVRITAEKLSQSIG
jgi:hypothetical protein